jgi:hypothetical protein
MFEFLDDYIIEKKGKRVGANSFNLLPEEEILEAEKNLGCSFPSQLRKFYEEVGCGTLQNPHIVPEDYKFSSANEILPPLDVVNFSKGILFWEGQNHWMAEATYELLSPGDLPFFEIADSTRFLIMKPNSDNPNAVWIDSSTVKIEDSFEKFIWRLYYESPWFYDDIIEKYYASKK